MGLGVMAGEDRRLRTSILILKHSKVLNSTFTILRENVNILLWIQY